MGGPLSVTLVNIVLTKLENVIVAPTRPNFLRRFMDNVFTTRDIRKEDLLLKMKIEEKWTSILYY